MALIYIGDGGYLPDIPARDLTDDEVEQFGGEELLIKTGLYKKAEAPAKTTRAAKAAKKEGD